MRCWVARGSWLTRSKICHALPTGHGERLAELGEQFTDGPLKDVTIGGEIRMPH